MPAKSQGTERNALLSLPRFTGACASILILALGIASAPAKPLTICLGSKLPSALKSLVQMVALSQFNQSPRSTPKLSEEDWSVLWAVLRETVTENPFIPHQPHPTQAAFLALTPVREVLYGGAAGGGKSAALLMAALQYVAYPEYRALLLRRTFQDLKQPGALIELGHEWIEGKARWSSQDHSWTFPSGAVLKFGYCDTENDIYQYQGGNFHFVGWDELTQFREKDYRYLFSRMRRSADCKIPIRMRAASNPGGIGHRWVKERFIENGRANGRWFIPARLDDNPSLDKAEYIHSLDTLDPVTRARLLNGDWSVAEGSMFRRDWFGDPVDQAPSECRWCRYWDLAATKPRAGHDPDFTAGALLGLSPEGIWFLKDMRHCQESPLAIEHLISQTKELDGWGVMIRMEQEPGASGVHLIDHYRRGCMVGRDFMAEKPEVNKIVRAQAMSSAAQAGNFKLVKGPWNAAFLDEAEVFPLGDHDDQIDAASGAMRALAPGPDMAPIVFPSRRIEVLAGRRSREIDA